MTSNTNQKALYRTTIKRMFGMAKANGHFKVQWQGTNNNSIVHITTGQFDYDFQSMGDGAVVQNTEAGTNGDIVFSTVGQTQPDTFTLFIDLRKDFGDFDAGQTNDPLAFNRGRAAGP
jgi:hypothetical protein